MKDLNKEMLLHKAAQAVGRPGAGLTRQYVFDPRHAVQRSIGAMLGPTRKTVLQFLFDDLDSDERARLFPGNFDLGNLRVPPVPTKAALQIELETATELARQDGDNPEHALRAIKQQIKRLTGYHFDDYFAQDAGKSLKVLKLLYLLNRYGEDRLFSLLTPPDGKRKPSLEVANPYPLQENMAAAALVADLKAHLTLELPAARRHDIDDLFEPLREQLDAIDAQLRNVVRARGGMDFHRNRTLLSLANEVLAQLDKPDHETPLLLPLDEKLYLHCCTLEIIHLAKAQRHLYQDHAPALQVQPIGKQLNALSAAIQGKPDATASDPCISIAGFEGVVAHHADAIRGALEAGLGYAVSATRYNNAIPLAVTLLRMGKAYGSEMGLRGFYFDFQLDPLTAIAALASVCHHAGPPTTKYRPYWLGQDNDRGNVIAALKKIDFQFANSTVAEEYNRFWMHQLQWFRHALAGQLSVYQHQTGMTLHLIDAVAAIVRLHDTALLRYRMAEYAQLPQYLAAMLDHVVHTL